MSAIRDLRVWCIGAGTVLALAPAAWATTFASSVLAYDLANSASIDPGYQDVSAAVTLPTGYTGTDFGFPSVVTPFNPAFDYDQLVVVGSGGYIELEFPTTITPTSGLDIGVFTNVGLTDSNWPAGVADNPADLFSTPNNAVVQVSLDGTHWVPLNGGNPIAFTIPTDYYSNNASLTTEPSNELTIPAGAIEADFGKPFAGSLSTFDGETYSQIEASLSGSGGGKWLSLGSTGLSGVNDIEFQVPDDGVSQLGLDAVSINETNPGLVPEPTSASLLVAGGLLMLARRSRRGR